MVVLLLFSCVVARGESLQNPGFEQLTQDKPLRWDCFLLPQEGAVARVSPIAHGGQRSVMLHVPMPYERDPLNNWSQNVLDIPAGSNVHAQVYVRIEAATEAVLWVQCWRKSTGTILETLDSGKTQPLTGTLDWTLAAVDFVVPAGTDFLTVRCVLKGTGTAWFDDASVEISTAASIAEGESATVARPLLPAPSGSAAVPAASAPLAPATPVQEDIERLKRANLLLAETLDRLQVEVSALRAEVERLKARQGTPVNIPPLALPSP